MTSQCKLSYSYSTSRVLQAESMEKYESAFMIKAKGPPTTPIPQFRAGHRIIYTVLYTISYQSDSEHWFTSDIQRENEAEKYIKFKVIL